MTNPTSNFGWQMPTATDLVTDLPADFEVFGQAVDTDFVDLLGGTTGQVLSKTSNTDLDFTWVAANPGDITGVTAGTGITGGGTSGTVTVTNDMATTITAAGDIVVGTGSGTYDNLPIGTTAQVLTADTTVSPYKVKWATPTSALTYVGASVRSSANQSISNTTETLLLWDTERFDTDAIHSTVTNTGRMTVPAGKTGKWLVSGQISHPNYGSTLGMEIYVYINGAYFQTGVAQFSDFQNTGGRWVFASMSQIFDLAATDYLELYAWQNSGGAANINTLYSNFQFTYMGA